MKTATNNRLVKIEEGYPKKKVSKAERDALVKKMQGFWKKTQTSVSIWCTRHGSHTGPCHASFPRTIRDAQTREPTITAAICDTGIRRRSLDVSLFEPFLKWLLSDDCLFAPFYENRDNFEECRDTGIIVNLTGAYAPTFAAVVLSRIFWEGSKESFEAFNSLISKGIPGDLAYMATIGSAYSTRSVPYTETSSHLAEWQWQARYSHTALITDKIGDWQKVLRREFWKSTDFDFSYLKHPTTLGAYALTTGGSRGDDFWYKVLLKKSPELRDALASYRGGGAGVEVPVVEDPFAAASPIPAAKKPSNPLDVSYKEVFECVLPKAYELGLFE